MNNALFAMLCLVSLASCKDERWYSSINKKAIIQENATFVCNVKVINSQLAITLNDFKKSLVEKNICALYKYRTQLYKATVSETVFKSQVIGIEKLPVDVYFSTKGSLIEKDKAFIKAYYVYAHSKFDSCEETIDQWTFDAKEDKWVFDNNTLSWGAAIIK